MNLNCRFCKIRTERLHNPSQLRAGVGNMTEGEGVSISRQQSAIPRRSSRAKDRSAQSQATRGITCSHPPGEHPRKGASCPEVRASSGAAEWRIPGGVMAGGVGNGGLQGPSCVGVLTSRQDV